jgi:N-acetyl-gamma-glutamyl-phosphate reductase
MTSQVLKAGILGASGYTGAELIRLLARHPNVEIAALSAESQAGKPMLDVYPHLAFLDLPPLQKIEDVNWGGLDIVFCGLPHATTQKVLAGLPSQCRIVDLSADFRLSDPAVYAEWYGHAHAALDLQKEAVYGLTEHAREAVKGARLVANPGCYPTAALLPLIPLVKSHVIQADDVIIDAKSGVTGAGRAPKQDTLFCEVSEGLHAYGVGKHRHMPEIEQELSKAAGRAVFVSFTPHLVPMNRGELATIFVKLEQGRSVESLREVLTEAYADEPFVQVAPKGLSPATRHVRGSNNCLINVFPDRIPGRAIVLSAIDNLVKGASGQAIQNMNVMFGIPETTGLEQVALFP